MAAVAPAGGAGGDDGQRGRGGDGHRAGGGTGSYGKTYQRRIKIPQQNQEDQGNQVDEPEPMAAVAPAGEAGGGEGQQGGGGDGRRAGGGTGLYGQTYQRRIKIPQQTQGNQADEPQVEELVRRGSRTRTPKKHFQIEGHSSSQTSSVAKKKMEDFTGKMLGTTMKVQGPRVNPQEAKMVGVAGKEEPAENVGAVGVIGAMGLYKMHKDKTLEKKNPPPQAQPDVPRSSSGPVSPPAGSGSDKASMRFHKTTETQVPTVGVMVVHADKAPPAAKPTSSLNSAEKEALGALVDLASEEQSQKEDPAKAQGDQEQIQNDEAAEEQEDEVVSSSALGRD